MLAIILYPPNGEIEPYLGMIGDMWVQLMMEVPAGNVT